MNPFPDVNQADSISNRSASETKAILVIAHIASDQALRDRFLDLSGVTPAELRAGVETEAVQMAALDFLAGHEPDLIACAGALGVRPEDLMDARNMLGATT
ncbi:MAG: DUF3572 family protein [Pacificimonas sp.]